MTSAETLRQTLQARFGLAFSVALEENPEGIFYRVRPANEPSTVAFSIEVLRGWRSIELRFRPDPFAAHLIRAMEAAAGEHGSVFRVFAKAAIDSSGDLRLIVNSTPCDPLGVVAAWPNKWNTCEISLRRGNLAWGSDELYDERTLNDWVCRFVGLVVSLLPLEPVNDEPVGAGEGGYRHVVVRRYERSRLNRAACIEIQGVRCIVCDLSFRELYGAIGEGFIHVHHLESVSTLVEGTVVDPARDLVPVCPNCHAMLHTSTPPMPPEQLRARLRPPAQAL